MQLSKKNIYLLIAVTGFLYAFSIFDLAFIFEQNAYWKEPLGDRITNHIGLLYFVNDSWRWPLFFVPTLGFPEGANIIYTDSIPFLALIAKIIFKLTGVLVNYFGAWIFLCFPLLGLFVALSVREGGVKDPVASVGSILLALASPALLVRFGHAALMGHFLIVWSFLLYLKLQNNLSLRSYTLQFAIVSSLCILLQTYFLLMVLPFFLAGLLQASVDKRIHFKFTFPSLIAVFASVILTAYIAGMIGAKGPSGSTIGFGLYSMNLLSPFLPVRDHLPHFISQYISWDANGYSLDATGGQYEGYNYLGAGVILLLAISVIMSFASLKLAIKRHVFLILALFSLLFLALSNRVYLGNWLLIDLPTNQWFGFFRTSGRLFWPIYYVLIIASIVCIFRRFKPNVARSILVIAVIAQLIDTEPHRQNLIAATKRGFPQVLSNDVWNKFLASHEFYEQYPSFQCGGWAKDWPQNNSNMELLMLVAKQHKPTNSAYLARSSRNCLNETVEAENIQIEKGGVYVFTKNFPIHEIKSSADFSKMCLEFNFGFVCSRNQEALSKLASASGFTKPTAPSVPIYPIGELLKFTTGGEGEKFLRKGWYGVESWGTWTKGINSELLLKIPHSDQNQYSLTAYARGFVHPGKPEKLIKVYINDSKIAEWKYKMGQEVTRYTAQVPRRVIPKDGVLKVSFVSDFAESPKQAGLSLDTKEISLGLIELSIDSVKS